MLNEADVSRSTSTTTVCPLSGPRSRSCGGDDEAPRRVGTLRRFLSPRSFAKSDTRTGRAERSGTSPADAGRSEGDIHSRSHVFSPRLRARGPRYVALCRFSVAPPRSISTVIVTIAIPLTSLSRLLSHRIMVVVCSNTGIYVSLVSVPKFVFALCQRVCLCSCLSAPFMFAAAK